MSALRARIRRAAYSPSAPLRIAHKITDLLFLAGAALVVWLCFGGPLFTLYCDIIVMVGRHVGTVA